MNPMQTETLEITSKSSHPIFIGTQILDDIPAYIQKEIKAEKVVIITNTNLIDAFGNALKKGIESKKIHCTIIDIPSGEEQKTFQTVSQILNQLLTLKLERNDCIIALGGGVIGDLAGFIASIYLRGIPLIQVPTTLLAQVDASIGGKTGVNHPKGKNLIGTFYQAKAIFIDTATLHLLPKRELRAGLAEIAKYAITLNTPLFHYMTKHLKEIIKFSPSQSQEIWQHMIKESVKNKVSIVSEDEKESGKRAILNFGHTIGHGIEAATNFKTFLHGEAVAIGMLIETEIAEKLSLISDEEAKKIKGFLNSLSYEETNLQATPEKIVEKMQMDKKVKSGKLHYVLPTEIGKTIISNQVPIDIVKELLAKYCSDATL
jgi:3-dehydroquinate synthase